MDNERMFKDVERVFVPHGLDMNKFKKIWGIWEEKVAKNTDIMIRVPFWGVIKRLILKLIEDNADEMLALTEGYIQEWIVNCDHTTIYNFLERTVHNNIVKGIVRLFIKVLDNYQEEIDTFILANVKGGDELILAFMYAVLYTTKGVVL